MLAAQNIQPDGQDFPGLRSVVHAGIDDNGERDLSVAEWETALRAADFVASSVRAKRRVLVTCQMGVNRSGLIVAVALHKLTGLPGRSCIEIVRKNRGMQHVPGTARYLMPLCNKSFERAVAALPDRR